MSADVKVTVTVPGDLADRLREWPFSEDYYDGWVADRNLTPALRSSALFAAAVKRSPRPFQVGDRVRCGNDRFGVVKALAADLAWVHVEGVVSGRYATFHVNELSHVEVNQ